MNPTGQVVRSRRPISPASARLRSEGIDLTLTSAAAYATTEGTRGWVSAASDTSYRMIADAARSFSSRWRTLCSDGDVVPPGPVTLVSVGPGDGLKDAYLTAELGREHAVRYVPVDVSSTMLDTAVATVSELGRVTSCRPVVADVSSPDDLAAVRRTVEEVPETATLVSILGNTMANFDADREALEQISSTFPTPRLVLVELATIGPDTDAPEAVVAAEYAGSAAVRDWLASSLEASVEVEDTATGRRLGIMPEALEFQTRTVPSGTVELHIVYRNRGPSPLLLHDGRGGPQLLAPARALRLFLTRKYSGTGLRDLLRWDRHRTTLVDNARETGPGLALALRR